MITIVSVPAFEDNYIWLIHNNRHAAAVDPGDAAPVRDYLERKGLKLAAILVTHHHGDHTDGIAELLQQGDIPVYGPVRGSLATVARPVSEGGKVVIPELATEFTVMDFPGHTRDHVGYALPGALFCGDTLFTLGCGRLFEGTPEQAERSMEKIRTLPDDTLIYCAHEYTLENLPFARKADPSNLALLHRGEEAVALRAAGLPTVPSTLRQEKDTNPFLRFDIPEVIRTASDHAGRSLSGPVEVFAVLRAWRDEK